MSALIVVLVAIVIAAAIGALLVHYGLEGYGGLEIFMTLCGFALLAVAGASAVCYAFAGWEWIAADSKAQIINREYGTAYTREEVFFASDVIDTIREIDRKRVEVNGDLLRDKKD